MKFLIINGKTKFITYRKQYFKILKMNKYYNKYQIIIISK